MRRLLIQGIVAVWLLVLSIQFSFSQDSSMFIGRMWYLQGTDEFYTTISFKPELNDSTSRSELIPQLDSVITKEYYLTRRGLSKELAEKYFNLQNYQQVVVFNQSHDKVTTCRLHHVEYYEDMIDGMFIAVFDHEEMDDESKSELVFYGTSAQLSPKLVDKFKHEELTKNQLDKNIINFLQYNKDDLMKSKHLEIKKGNLKKVSILSIEDLENFTYQSYMLEHNGNRVSILKQLKGDYVFWDLLPVPYLIHDKPVFIVEIIIPDSDYTGYMLAIYNGAEYELQNRMEISI